MIFEALQHHLASGFIHPHPHVHVDGCTHLQSPAAVVVAAASPLALAWCVVEGGSLQEAQGRLIWRQHHEACRLGRPFMGATDLRQNLKQHKHQR